MEKQVLSITKIKVKIYIGALICGTVLTLGIWGLDFIINDSNSLSRVYLPVLAVFYLISIRWIWKHDEKFIRYFERFIYISTAGYILGFFVRAALIGAKTGFLDLNKYLLWMVMLYTVPFVMFSSKTALRLSLGSYSLIFVTGIWFLLVVENSSDYGQDLSTVFQILVSNLLYIIILSVIVNLKDTVQEVEGRAILMFRLANTDPLTGINNRRKLNDTIVSLIQGARPFSVIMVDIDGFKHINDTYGHDAGDNVLKYFSNELSKIIRKNDAVGRWGGDEFLIVCPELNSADAVSFVGRLKNIGETVDPKVARPFHLSIGIATSQEADTMSTLLKRADIDLYHDKARKG